MQIAHVTTQKEADEIQSSCNHYCELADGDMMILSQGNVILEAVVFNQFEAVEGQKVKVLNTRVFIYRYASYDICNYGDTIGFNVYQDSDFVSCTVFDNAQEAKLYMLKIASESMMLNNY